MSRETRAAQERLLAELRDSGDPVLVWNVMLEVEDATGDVASAIEVARQLTGSPSDIARPVMHFFVAHLFVISGQWRAAQAELDSAEPLRERTLEWPALETRAYLSVYPFVPVPPEELQQLRSRVEGIERSGGESVASPFLAGLLSARLGDEVAVERHAATLDSMSVALLSDLRSETGAADPADGTPQHWAAMAKDAALQVRATAAWFARQPEETLTWLDQMNVEQWGSIEWTRMWGTWGHLTQYLRAEALRALGRDDEAQLHYEQFGRMLRDALAVAPAHFRRAEIAERRGDLETAAHHYRRFLEMWSDADPEYQPQLDEARAALARLEAEPQDP